MHQLPMHTAHSLKKSCLEIRLVVINSPEYSSPLFCTAKAADFGMLIIK